MGKVYRSGQAGYDRVAAAWKAQLERASRRPLGDFNEEVAALTEEVLAFIGPVPKRRDPSIAELKARHEKRLEWLECERQAALKEQLDQQEQVYQTWRRFRLRGL